MTIAPGSRPGFREERTAIGYALRVCRGPGAALVLLLAASCAGAQGLSPGRLARIDTTVREYVETERIAGAVILVLHGGRAAQLGAYGKRDIEAGDPMRKDSIFRIASMSKAVTSVAALILMEEGRLLLTDPVSKYIPAFKKTTVMVPRAEGSAPEAPVKTIAAKREITIRDLMTHTSGISYGAGPAEAQYKAANLYLWYFADKDEPIAAAIERLAGLPFEAQPGEKWVYGFSSDVLGRVVEVASGMTLDGFFAARIFTPLKMVDTSFFLPREKRSRLATLYAAKESGGLARAPSAGREGQGEYVDGPRRCFSGGAGLLSTASDYGRFLQMLVNGGELDGVRVLSPKSVELATSNHVGQLYEEGLSGFGLGFAVVEKVGRAGRLASVGEFSWGSAYYSSYWADPADAIVGVFLAQLLPARGLDLQQKFRTLVYQAVVPAAR